MKIDVKKWILSLDNGESFEVRIPYPIGVEEALDIQEILKLVTNQLKRTVNQLAKVGVRCDYCNNDAVEFVQDVKETTTDKNRRFRSFDVDGSQRKWCAEHRPTDKALLGKTTYVDGTVEYAEDKRQQMKLSKEKGAAEKAADDLIKQGVTQENMHGTPG